MKNVLLIKKNIRNIDLKGNITGKGGGTRVSGLSGGGLV